jgi:hypothetical protein
VKKEGERRKMQEGRKEYEGRKGGICRKEREGRKTCTLKLGHQQGRFVFFL